LNAEIVTELPCLHLSLLSLNFLTIFPGLNFGAGLFKIETGCLFEDLLNDWT